MTSRRRFLSGATLAGGGSLFQPLLGQVRAQATGITPATRFVFVVEGNGLPPNQVTPSPIKRIKQSATLVDESLEGLELPESLQPVKAFQKQLTIVNGLSGKVAGGGHSNDFGALGVYHCGSGVGSSGSPRGETIDAALGKKLGGIFPHVGLGMCDRAGADIIYNCSAWGNSQPLPTICQPMTAYGHLFGSVASGNSKAEFHAKTNLLDFLLDDVKRIHREVAPSEREKLEAHLGGYEDMRQRQSRLGEIEGTLRQHAPKPSDKYRSTNECDRLDAQFDIAAAALTGGLTNSLTIASGVGNPFFSVKYTGLGIGIGKHSIGHGGGFEGLSAAELMVKIRKFHFELIAGLMRKLEKVPEGNGTMLDHTVIVYLSDAAEGHHSRCWEWPFVLIPGKETGLRGGRYLDFPYWGKPGHREIGNLYTTLLHGVGDKRTYFGQHDALLKGEATADGPLPELLA